MGGLGRLPGTREKELRREETTKNDSCCCEESHQQKDWVGLIGFVSEYLGHLRCSPSWNLAANTKYVARVVPLAATKGRKVPQCVPLIIGSSTL